MKNGLDLGGAYAAMLGRIKAEGGEKARLGMAALMWISHSRRPLQVEELCHAIAIRIGSDDLDNDDIPTISTLLDFCQGLVTVDKGGSTVRLIHFTLQEHLCTHPNLFDAAHSTMAETCLTYINFQLFKDLPAAASPDPRDTPFLKYSSLHWGTHMRIELSDRAVTFALQLLYQFDGHISAKCLLESINDDRPFGYYSGDKPFSALYCTSYLGIPEVIITLLKMNTWDVNQRDSLGVTPLIWAARYGHEEVVRLLLQEKNLRPDEPDANNGRTALSWAAGNGHEGVVRLFLAPQFVNPETVGRQWGKAARLVGLLFGERYVNPNSLSEYGRTPLSWAAEGGHEGIAKLLLERPDIGPDTPDTEYGRTPLSRATQNGHEGIVKLLLGRKDVNPDTPDKYGRTPLSWAAENGHEKIAKLLLERQDVNPDTPDTTYGRTPLLWAALKGYEGIVRLLLGRKDVNPDTPDTEYCRTPLSWAAENGYEIIAMLRLERTDVNPNTPDTLYGRTPLSRATQNGHEGIVKLLLGRKDVNPNTPDRMYGRTPLLWAAGNGHEGIVTLLLGRKDVNPNSLSKYGETPLWLATSKGHYRVIELLQDRHPYAP